MHLEQVAVYACALLFAFAFYILPQIQWKDVSQKFEREDYAGAEKVLTKIISQKWLGQNSQASAYGYRAFARCARADYDGASSDSDCALKAQPENILAKAAKGWCLWYESRDAVSALKYITSALEANPSSPLLNVCKGDILTHLGRYAEAIDAFSSSIEARSEEPSYYLRRACAYFGLGKIEDASADCDKAIALKPNSAISLAFRAWILGTHYNANAALYDCSRALELNPSSTYALEAFAAVLYYLNNPEDALFILDQVTFSGGHDRWSHLSLRAACLLHLNRFQEAIAVCADALKRDPQYAAAMINRAYANLCLGNLDAAKSDLEAARRLCPDEPLLASNQARLLLARNLPGKADELLESFASEHPEALTKPGFLTTRGMVLTAINAPERALSFLNKALEIDERYLQAMWHRGDAMEKTGAIDAGAAEKKKALELGYRPRA